MAFAGVNRVARCVKVARDAYFLYRTAVAPLACVAARTRVIEKGTGRYIKRKCIVSWIEVDGCRVWSSGVGGREGGRGGKTASAAALRSFANGAGGCFGFFLFICMSVLGLPSAY